MSLQAEHPVSPPKDSQIDSGSSHVPAVMASDFTNWATGEGVAFGLRSRGWKIAEVDRRHYLGAAKGVLRIARRLMSATAVQAYNDAIVAQCEGVGARAFLTMKGSFIRGSTIEKLQQRSVLTAIYYTDRDFDRPDVDMDVIRNVDVLFTTKSFQLDWLKKVRGDRATYFVPHGYPTMVELAAGDVPAEPNYAHDIAYIGNPDAAKVELLSQIYAQFPKASILIAGNGWRKATARLPLASRVSDHPVVGDFLAEAHRRARVNLAFHMGVGPNGWADLVSRRTFEIPAFRGFMLHVDNSEVRALYDVPAEIDVFRDASELIEKITYYLDRPDLRRHMIERAHRRAVPAYGHHSRGIEIDALLRPLLR